MEPIFGACLIDSMTFKPWPLHSVTPTVRWSRQEGIRSWEASGGVQGVQGVKPKIMHLGQTEKKAAVSSAHNKTSVTAQ